MIDEAGTRGGIPKRTISAGLLPCAQGRQYILATIAYCQRILRANLEGVPGGHLWLGVGSLLAIVA